MDKHIGAPDHYSNTLMKLQSKYTDINMELVPPSRKAFHRVLGCFCGHFLKTFFY